MKGGTWKDDLTFSRFEQVILHLPPSSLGGRGIVAAPAPGRGCGAESALEGAIERRGGIVAAVFRDAGETRPLGTEPLRRDGEPPAREVLDRRLPHDVGEAL